MSHTETPGVAGVSDYSKRMDDNSYVAMKAGVDLGMSGRNGGFNNFSDYQRHKNNLIHMARNQGITLHL